MPTLYQCTQVSIFCWLSKFRGGQMFLRSLVKLNDSILVWNFVPKFRWRPKKSFRRILVLSQSWISDFLLPSGNYLPKNWGDQTYFAPSVGCCRCPIKIKNSFVEVKPFFGNAVWSVDHEYQVLKIFINVYLTCQADFVAHFSKNLHFFATRERYG